MERIIHNGENYVQVSEETFPTLEVGSELYLRKSYDNKELSGKMVKLASPKIRQQNTGQGQKPSVIVFRPDGEKWSVYMSEVFAREVIASPTAHSVPSCGKTIDISSMKFHKEGEYYISEDHSVFLLESKFKAMFNDVE